MAIFEIFEISYASTIIVTDKLGRKVFLDVPVKRAVMTVTYELIPALNIWNQVVGVSRWAEEGCGLYKAIVKENPSFRRPLVGGGIDINVEAVLKLKPDVVITWTYVPDTIRFLESKGIKVIGIWPENLTELYKDIRLHGMLFGKEKRAEEVIKEMEKILNFIRNRVSKISLEKRKKVIHVVSTPTRVSGKLVITNDIIKIAGAINIAEEINKNYIDVSVEKIVQWNPDVIFIWGSARYDESWFYNNSQFRFIKAVKKRQIYKLPKWSTWSPRVAPIALYMAMKIYPEVFKDINFEEIVDNFYKKV
ncbi:MAG: ABC transporter substrate-binding protein, partial [Candidatus Omnitrophica bacterium]|nr:ABC transporter substrate-binding protein [Candidatus Omnitrophota bacterium]